MIRHSSIQQPILPVLLILLVTSLTIFTVEQLFCLDLKEMIWRVTSTSIEMKPLLPMLRTFRMVSITCLSYMQTMQFQRNLLHWSMVRMLLTFILNLIETTTTPTLLRLSRLLRDNLWVMLQLTIFRRVSLENRLISYFKTLDVLRESLV